MTPRALTLALAIALAATPTRAYDPMEDLVSSAQREINAHEAIETSKKRVLDDPRRRKVEQGFWQFFQAQRGAKPGQYCTAVYWKRDRMISISGPGGGYQGALLGFVAVQPDEGFPRPDHPKDRQKLKITLTQGRDAPATLTALNGSIGGLADQIQVAVPTIDAALAGMEDRLAFRIDHAGRRIFELEWHAGLAARDLLRRCLQGENVDGRELP